MFLVQSSLFQKNLTKNSDICYNIYNSRFFLHFLKSVMFESLLACLILGKQFYSLVLKDTKFNSLKFLRQFAFWPNFHYLT